MPTLPPLPAMQEGNDAPWTIADAVTPHDDNDLPYHSRGIYIGTGGDIAVTMSGQTDNTAAGKRIFKNVPDGTLLPFFIRRVWATGTVGASDIVCGT